jgi:hypothetical protein
LTILPTADGAIADGGVGKDDNQRFCCDSVIYTNLPTAISIERLAAWLRSIAREEEQCQNEKR